MDNSFFSYLQQLELMAFFSGYPLLYALIFFIAGNQRSDTSIKGRLVSLLPLAYALVGTLFLGLQLKNLYPDYSFENIKQALPQPQLVIWALLSLLFWIPALTKKPALSLFHSLVFFFFLVRDLFLKSSFDKNIVRNDMKMYTNSILINLAAFAVITILFLLYNYNKNRKRSRPRD